MTIIPVLKECPDCEADYHGGFGVAGKNTKFPLVIVYYCKRCKKYYLYDVKEGKNEVAEKPEAEGIIIFRNPLRPEKIISAVTKFVAVCKFVYPRFPECISKCRDGKTAECPYF